MTTPTIFALDSLPLSQLSWDSLTAIIAKHYPDWQCFYLFNNNQPVIGICPRASFLLQTNPSPTSHDNTPNQLFCLHTTHSDGTQSRDYVSFQEYKRRVIDYHQQCQQTYICDNPASSDGDTHHYHHGLMGYIGYDVSAQALNPAIHVHGDMPCAYFAHYDCYISMRDDKLVLIGFDDNKLKDISAQLSRIQDTELTPFALPLTARWSKQDYAQAFDKVQAYLQAGDAYQINLTQAWCATSQQYLYHYLPIIQQTQAPYLGYLLVRDCEIVSASPELFFQFDASKSRSITTRPIKGTRKRHDNPTIDNALKAELESSEKDIAENVMIVDLLRNDLGKYAKVGQVRVPERFAVHSYSNVHHMISTISAELKDDVSVLTVLFDSLPAGSITGSPKKRACEIINELECAPRGAYCGSMGFVNFDDTGAFNVLIRTLQSYPNRTNRTVELWAGGGVTVLSNCADEYQESVDKITHLKSMFLDKTCQRVVK